MSLEDIYFELSKKNYKLTKQRKVILEAFFRNLDSFLSVEEIQEETNKSGTSLDLSTIYRNINLLEKCNLVCKIQNYNSHLYKIRTTKKHHHHLICKNCGKSVAFDFCPTDTFCHIAEKNDFIFTDDKIELYGYCNKCKNTL